MNAIRPRLELFDTSQIDEIVENGLRVLDRVGFFVENDEALQLLREAGVRLVGRRAHADESAIRRALSTAPSRVIVYDRDGRAALDLGGDRVHFDPGSAALYLQDPATGIRRPATPDLVRLAWVTESCRNLAGQSTALVPADVPEEMGDRFRLYVALQNCRKPVITGTFRKDAFPVMRDMLAAVRGGARELAEKPLAIFDCCPTPPLKWSDLTCQALIDCARTGIPAQLVSMPLGGATSPVTLREMIVQHCAESLSGVLIHQLARPGSPIVFGGSPAAFDLRHGTTPMGAIETMMVDIGYAQVGRRLGLPTHAYMGPSDAKVVDWQAGMESSAGLILATLGCVNLVSGPGMLDFENCQSLEKLVLDNEACGIALRLAAGVSHRSAAEAVDLLSEMAAEGSFLGHRHTREHFRAERYLVSRLIDRSTHEAWAQEGSTSAADRARSEVARIVARGNPAPVEPALARELERLVREDARRLNVTSLPSL